jgi:protein-tyrosine phosphatase
MIRSVLMVCEGNVCRSPLAAAMLAREIPHLQVDSAGTHALVGALADEAVAQVAAENGLALEAHIGKQLDETLARNADLIFTMTQTQRDWVLASWPFTRGRVFRLCEEDVVDPYRRHRTVSDLAFAQIREGISQRARTLSTQ